MHVQLRTCMDRRPTWSDMQTYSYCDSYRQHKMQVTETASLSIFTMIHNEACTFFIYWSWLPSYIAIIIIAVWVESPVGVRQLDDYMWPKHNSLAVNGYNWLGFDCQFIGSYKRSELDTKINYCICFCHELYICYHISSMTL